MAETPTTFITVDTERTGPLVNKMFCALGALDRWWGRKLAEATFDDLAALLSPEGGGEADSWKPIDRICLRCDTLVLACTPHSCDASPTPPDTRSPGQRAFEERESRVFQEPLGWSSLNVEARRSWEALASKHATKPAQPPAEAVLEAGVGDAKEDAVRRVEGGSEGVSHGITLSRFYDGINWGSLENPVGTRPADASIAQPPDLAALTARVEALERRLDRQIGNTNLRLTGLEDNLRRVAGRL